MGVYWNPANACYYRSLERSARNVYLATQGTSGRQSVRTPTGINYIEGTTGSGRSSAKKEKCETADPTLAGALKEAGASGNITLRQLKEILLQGVDAGDKDALETRAKSLTGPERQALREALDAGLFKHRTARSVAEQLANGGGFSVIGIRSAQP